MAQIGLDLFDFAGKKHILCVDKCSGFPLFKRLQTQSTKAVTDILESWFNVWAGPHPFDQMEDLSFVGHSVIGVRKITSNMNYPALIILNQTD